MDPVSLAALGMAGNVIQFVDFGFKLASKARNIYKDGCDREYVQLEVVLEDLTRCSDSLQTHLDSQKQQVGDLLSESDAALKEICIGCLQVAGELQMALKKLSPNRSPSKWKSVRQALKSLWGKERLAELKDPLQMYSSQMDSHILISLRYVCCAQDR